MVDSYALLEALTRYDLPVTLRDPWWWPNSGTYEVVIGAVLTQNSRWERVEMALEHLRELGALSIDGLGKIDADTLREAIKPAGFYNTKAKRLKLLNQAIQDKFGDFATFQMEIDRDWLLARKGVGEETADAILNYGCYREVMVVDAYTARLLEAFGYTFETYRALQAWMVAGLKANDTKMRHLFPTMPKAQIYALFHGRIVAYVKRHKRGRSIDIAPLESLGLSRV